MPQIVRLILASLLVAFMVIFQGQGRANQCPGNLEGMTQYSGTAIIVGQGPVEFKGNVNLTGAVTATANANDTLNVTLRLDGPNGSKVVESGGHYSLACRFSSR